MYESCSDGQVTQYLDQIAILQTRVAALEKALVSRDEVNEAWESHRQLYKDLFEEMTTLRERMWRLGT